MTLLVGTAEGLYVVPDGDVRGADRAIDAPVHRLRRFDGPGVLAATADGVYRSVSGREWSRLGPDVAVHSVLGTHGGRIYAGTDGAGLFATDDGGGTWRELDGPRPVLDTVDRSERSSREDARVRTLAAGSGHSGRVLAGVDPGGVFVTDDGGETWQCRSRGVDDAVHHLLAVGSRRTLHATGEDDGLAAPGDDATSALFGAGEAVSAVNPDDTPDGTYVASTGDGVYATADVGETWVRLDARERRIADHREAAVHDGSLYTAARGAGSADPEAVVRRYVDSDGTVRSVSLPGASGEFVSAFGTHVGRLLAGTTDHADGIRPGEPGRVLVRAPDGTWSTLGETPAGVSSLLGL